MKVGDLLAVMSGNLTEVEIYDINDNEIASGTVDYLCSSDCAEIKMAIVQNIETRLTYMNDVIFEVYTDYR